ncbi:MAG: DUF6438 domain-containing protein, partial [Telluria sp.]
MLPLAARSERTAAPASGTVLISLERSMCYGQCPAYRVDIHGDGSMLFEGFKDVTVLGKERYVLAPEEVNKLVRSALAKNLMSLKTNYYGNVTDMPTYTLRLTLGGRTHQIADNAGQLGGMPATVSQFQQE